ncbi:programmed cell death protein 7 [Conger conger]|uniref:programmed cell death protein 7 n=1 Tax=Conger conger TaxID=82655 RepID=UPI002A5A9E8F|nr:programmed cell death protein 7 [Conger conger]
MEPFQRFQDGPQQSSSNSGYSDPNFCDTRSGAFTRPPLPQPSYDSPGAFQSTSAVPGGFWSGPSIYQQQTPVNSQLLNYVQTEWPPTPPAIGHGRDGYGAPLPQHSFNRGHQNMVPDFDPTRPPPPLYEPQPLPFPGRFDDRKGPVTDSSCRPPLDYLQRNVSVQQWQQASDVRPHSQLGAPHFNRHLEEHQAYPNCGPPIQTGFQNVGSNELHYQRQNNQSQGNRSSTDHQTHNDRWHQQAYQCSGNSKEIQPSFSDAEAKEKLADKQWLVNFLLKRKTTKSSTSKQMRNKPSIGEVRETLYSAARLVSELSAACEKLKENVENENVWTESYPKAVAMKTALLQKLILFSDPVYIETVKNKLAHISKKRLRNRRKKRERVEDQKEEDARAAEREAAIDKWRMKRIQKVEEKKRELELKMAADSVLSEVRKKQADAKRMLDILRSLEKLRKLRKEAAGRKGVFPETEADEVFEGHVERLRKLIQKRNVVYAAEEKALRVMLEGEQEEERKKEQERRQKKDREKFLQKKWEAETMLFGEEMHPDHPLQPFRQCYTQAEHSLHALIQIRRDWDAYLVPIDHPDGSVVPQGWVLPEPPSDETWASALEK